MIKKLLIIVFIIFSFSLNAQTVPWSWAKQTYGTRNAYGKDVASDKLGNTYVLGYFYDSLYIDTVKLFGAYASHTDQFIIKYDSLGKVQWVKHIILTESFTGQIKTDSHNNIYITVYYKGYLKVDNLLLQSPTWNSFILKLSPSGNILLAKQLITKGGTRIKALAIDQYDNFVIAGVNSDTVDFTQGFRTYKPGMFIVKYDSSGLPHSLITEENCGVNSVNVSTNSDIIFTGIVYDTTVIGIDTVMPKEVMSFHITGNDTEIYYLYPTGFLFIRYDSLGSILWHHEAFNNSANQSMISTIDDNSNLYVCAAVKGDMNFWGTTTISTNPFLFNYRVLMKIDPSGNIGWTIINQPLSINYNGLLDIKDIEYQDGFLYLCGFPSGTSSLSNLIVSAISYKANTMIIKMDTTGFGVCALMDTNNHNNNIVWGISLDENGNISVCGEFDDSCHFGNTLLVDSNPGGYRALFAAKMPKINLVGIDELPFDGEQIIRISPNPSDGNFYMESSEKIHRIEIFNSSGRTIQKINFEHTKSCNLKIESPGIYFIKITGDKNIYSKKIIVVK